MLPIFHSGLRHPLERETTLYLVRHGRTESNVHLALCGSTDVPLDELGLRQAALLAERIRRDLTVDVLLSSPLQRALTTARIVGSQIGLEPVVVPELTEMDFGQLEGVTIDRIAEEHPKIAVRMNDVEDDDFGWPGGDSRRGFHARVLRVFQAILADYPGGRVMVVAHGGVIGSFLNQVAGESPNDWRRFPMLNCGLTHLHVTSEGATVHLLNDAGHLEALDSETERGGAKQ